MSTEKLLCDLCGGDAGCDPYHVTMNGNRHVHMCEGCFDPLRHDVAIQESELLESLEEILGWQSLAPADVQQRARAAIAKARGAA